MCTDRPAIDKKSQTWEIRDKNDLISWISELLNEWDEEETTIFHDDLARVILENVSETLHLLQFVGQGEQIQMLSPEELLHNLQDH